MNVRYSVMDFLFKRGKCGRIRYWVKKREIFLGCLEFNVIVK